MYTTFIVINLEFKVETISPATGASVSRDVTNKSAATKGMNHNTCLIHSSDDKLCGNFTLVKVKLRQLLSHCSRYLQNKLDVFLVVVSTVTFSYRVTTGFACDLKHRLLPLLTLN